MTANLDLIAVTRHAGYRSLLFLPSNQPRRMILHKLVLLWKDLGPLAANLRTLKSESIANPDHKTTKENTAMLMTKLSLLLELHVDAVAPVLKPTDKV